MIGKPTEVPVEALLFDLGGVLLRIDFGRVFARWGREASCAPAELAARFAMDEAYAAHERGEIDFSAYCRHLRHELGIALDDAAMLEGWNDIFIGPVPWIDEVLAEASSRWPLYGFSNTNAVHRTTWTARFGSLLSPIREIHCSHVLGMRKPDREAYCHVARLIGVAPSAILFFDDSPENVAGATAAGLRARWIDPGGDVAMQLRSALNSVA